MYTPPSHDITRRGGYRGVYGPGATPCGVLLSGILIMSCFLFHTHPPLYNITSRGGFTVHGLGGGKPPVKNVGQFRAGSLDF